MSDRGAQRTRSARARHGGSDGDGYARFAARALPWLEARIEQFGFPRPHAGSLLPLVKPIGELAILSDLLLRAPRGSALHRKGRAWLEHAFEQLERGRFLARLVRVRPDMLYRVSTYVPFYRNGLRSRELERAVESALGSSGVRALEYFGWPGLELAVSLHELGIAAPRRWTIERAFAETWLSHRPDPASITDFAAYSLTHSVFYLTRFGLEPERLPARHRRYVARWAPVWGEHYYRKRHWDLMGEMVIVLRCLGEPDDRDWAGRLLGAQVESGLVPGPSGDCRHLDPRCTDAARIHFLESYHPTLVGLIAALLSLDGMRGPARTSTR